MSYDNSVQTLLGLQLGKSEMEVEKAQQSVKKIQEAAKQVRSITSGKNNKALIKALGGGKTGVDRTSQVINFKSPSFINLLSNPGQKPISYLPPFLQELSRRPLSGSINTSQQNTAARVTPPSSYKDVTGVSSTNYNPDGPGGRWDVLDIGNFNPTSLTTIPVGNGKSVTVNAAVADRFAGFLKDLQTTGYKIDSIGGHADRNARGSNRPSMHKYGLAIDINPSRNPMTGALITDMPNNIRDIAAKYNLVWGGDWNGRTKDTMHFSFPFQGGK